jgi:TolA-binding protein
MLSVPSASPPGSAGGASEALGTPTFWLPALFSDGELYLFDARLGLLIPGKDGKGVATLRDLQADTTFLRQLDLGSTPYPITADQSKHVAASLVADPFDLSRRARAIEGKLSGDDRLALSASPSALADKLKDVHEVTATNLWDVPFRVLRDQLRINPAQRRQMAETFEPFAWRPVLWKARVLHFQGHHRADEDAQDKSAESANDDHNQAVRLYSSKAVRPPDRAINDFNSPQKQKIFSAAKANASYWVGLLLFDEGKFDAAENWFHNPQLAASANETWAAGTRYNLARTLEAQGKIEDAVALYDKDASPQSHGNRLRAKWLKSKPTKPDSPGT